MNFIAATLRARGYPPSVREIALAVGLSSTSAVHHHLLMLERDGFLERDEAQSRAIRLTPTAAIQLGLSPAPGGRHPARPVARAGPAVDHRRRARAADRRRDCRRRPDRGIPGRV